MWRAVSIPGRPARPVVGTALVLGSYRATGIAAVRALAAAGYRVIVGHGGEYSTADRSRYCHEVWRHPPLRDPEALLVALVALLERRPEIVIILPLMERYVTLLAEQRGRLPDAVVLAVVDTELVRTCADKQRMYEIASDLGVPHRPLRVAHDLDSLARLTDEVGYPCVVRPSGTGPMEISGRKAIICKDRASVDRAVPAWPRGHPTLLVQRYVAGALHTIHFIAREGQLLGTFENRGLRHDSPDRTGHIVDWTTIAPHGERLGYLELLLERLAYTGIGCAQFLVPPRGEPHFLEINPRHGSAYGMAERSGMPLTMAAIGLASDSFSWPGAARFRHRPGRRVAWTSWDIHGLATAIRERNVDSRSAARWFRRILRSAIRADMHLTWSWRDPLPTLVVYAHLAHPRNWWQKDTHRS